jgi:glutamyl-tRNA synthetase
VHLRIDDLDTARLRPEYLEDIFASLEWLGLDWDTGPRDAAGFRAGFSQSGRLGEYRQALERLAQAGDAEDGPLVYPCACSREKAKQDAAAAGSPGIYAGTCRKAGIPWERAAFPGLETPPGEIPREGLHLRVHVPSTTQVTLRAPPATGGADLAMSPGREMGDFVVWQKNGLPAYQLASVVDDEALGIDLVVRGLDLLPSSGAQAWLAGKLGTSISPQAGFLHHSLLLGRDGGKLSKSAGAESLQSLRARGGPQALLRFFASRLGIDPAGVSRPRDLIPGFSAAAIPRADLAWADFAGALGLA